LTAPDAGPAIRRMFVSGAASEPAIRCLQARSVSRSLRARLLSLPTKGRVLASFRRAWIIEWDGADLLAIVAPQVGNGPLNAVMVQIPDAWPALQPGEPVQVQGSAIQLGEWEVDLGGAETWEPCPEWNRLRAERWGVLGRLGRLIEWVGEHTALDSLLGLCCDWGRPRASDEGTIHARARQAAEAMWAGWLGDEVELRAGAARLAGLGSGLTPAGDDFALGTMLCAWLAHPDPARYSETIAEVSWPRTTMLSRAFLQAAAAGEFGAPWHRLLGALRGGSDEQVEDATREVLAFGHSSGADALAGFLWMGLRVAPELAGSQAA